MSVAAEWRQGGGRPSAAGYAVAVVDDHALVRELLVRLIKERDDVDNVIGYASLAPLLVAGAAPDLVLLHHELAGRTTDAGDVARLVERGTRVLVVSATNSGRHVRVMIQAGASGVVTMRDSLEVVSERVSAVLRGRGWMSAEKAADDAASSRPELSQQEERALVLYASGLKLDSVARRMGVRPGTAKQYLDRVRDKYGAVGRSVRTKTELYMAAVEDGLFRPAG